MDPDGGPYVVEEKRKKDNLLRKILPFSDPATLSFPQNRGLKLGGQIEVAAAVAGIISSPSISISSSSSSSSSSSTSSTASPQQTRKVVVGNKEVSEDLVLFVQDDQEFDEKSTTQVVELEKATTQVVPTPSQVPEPSTEPPKKKAKTSCSPVLPPLPPPPAPVENLISQLSPAAVPNLHEDILKELRDFKKSYTAQMDLLIRYARETRDLLRESNREASKSKIPLPPSVDPVYQNREFRAAWNGQHFEPSHPYRSATDPSRRPRH